MDEADRLDGPALFDFVEELVELMFSHGEEGFVSEGGDGGLIL